MAQFFRPKKVAITNKSKQLTIDALNHEGVGVSRDNNKVCFIDGALRGEVVKAKVIQTKAKFERLTTLKVLESSPHRVDPFCKHYSTTSGDNCGGCQLQHLMIEQQLAEKRLAVTALFAKFSSKKLFKHTKELNWQPDINSDSLNYRRSARIAVFYDKNKKQFQVGFRQKGAKKIINIDACPVLETGYQEVFNVFRKVLPELKMGKFITHIQLCHAQAYFVVVRHIKPLVQADIDKLSAIFKAFKWQLVLEGESGQYVFQDSKSEPPYLSYSLPEFNLNFNFTLDNFIQVNQKVNSLMLQQAVNWLDLNKNENVLDLFCGIGNFSLPIAQKVRSVTGIEGVKSSVEMAKYNAKSNQLDNAAFYCQDLSQDMTKTSWFKQDYDVLVLDPSRMGAYDILTQFKLKFFSKILYVSCDPVTLARDSKLILDAGFKLDKIGLMNMFPHTGHVESMALFSKE